FAMLKAELGNAFTAGLVGLRTREEAVELAEVDDGIHRFQAVRAGDRIEAPVRADEGLELDCRFLGDQPFEREGDADESVARQGGELLRVDLGHERDVEILERRDAQNLTAL